MTTYVIPNLFQTTLSSALSSSGTTVTVASTDNLPTLSSGQVMPLILNDAATRNVYEICYVTAITGASLTLERGQEGTSAVAWSIGDYCYSAFTEGTGAASSGDPTKTFQVANATTSKEAVNLSQVSGMYVSTGQDGSNVISITASSTLTAAQSGHQIDCWGASSSLMLTLPAVSKGLNYLILPCSQQLTISSGSTSMILSDGSSVTSVSNSLSSVGNPETYFFVTAHENGASWRVAQFGQTVVASADALNQAINWGFAQTHFAAINGSSSNVFNVGTPTSGTQAVRLDQFSGSGFGGSIYYTIPSNGSPSKKVIIQTGVVPSGTITPTNITFPIAFPTALISVFATVRTSSITNASEGPIYYNESQTSVTIDPSGSSTKPAFSWTAIGY